MTDSLQNVVKDTTEYILRSDVMDFYKDLAEMQSTQFTILVAVIGVVFAAVVGATWWWNYKGAKSQISEEIKSSTTNLQNMYDELEIKFNGFKEDLQKSVSEQIERSVTQIFNDGIADFDGKVDDIIKKNEEKLLSFQKDVDNRITDQQAELSRVFALHCNSKKSYYNGFAWWIKAAKLYNEVKNGEFTQIAVRAALNSLKKVEKKSVKPDALKEYIQEVKNTIPDYLKSERDEIIKLINELTAPDIPAEVAKK